MKQIIITLLAFLPLFVAGQEFAVENFELREFDLTAINEATKFIDDNGEDCALIKIETTEKGFFFDGGTIGIAKVDDNHTAEIWVYVPAGLRKITIMNNKYGVIRDYYFPITLVSARTYLMKLKLPNQAPDKRLEEKTDSLQMQMAEMQRQMQQLMQNQQQGNVQPTENQTLTVTHRVLTRKEVPKDVESYEIPYGVTEIGDYAFMKSKAAYVRNTALKNVIIPNSVTKIGKYAFADCVNLKNITIPNSITHIEEFAFFDLGRLEYIIIPNSVTYIGMGAFNFCSSMKYIVFQGSNTTIGKNCFHICNSLQTIYVPKGSRAFYEAQLPKKLRKLIVEQ